MNNLVPERLTDEKNPGNGKYDKSNYRGDRRAENLVNPYNVHLYGKYEDQPTTGKQSII